MNKVTLVAGAVLLLVACQDSTGPPLDTAPRVELNMLRHAGTGPRADWFVDAATGLSASRSASVAPRLEAYALSFWAVRGHVTSGRIGYADGQDFLTLTVPEDALLRGPDGSSFGDGDSLLITVSVDTSRFLVQLEPTGLVFDEQHPARLRIVYGRADPDLNGDGVVDETDDEIESTRLGLWYQEEEGEPWSGIDDDQSLAEKSLEAALVHFSNYAASW